MGSSRIFHPVHLGFHPSSPALLSVDPVKAMGSSRNFIQDIFFHPSSGALLSVVPVKAMGSSRNFHPGHLGFHPC
jgi:hypothetical protein